MTGAATDVQGTAGGAKSALPGVEDRRRLRRWRAIKDKSARYFVGFGGITVIGALALMFFYLLSEVAPMLMPASIKEHTRYAAPSVAGDTTMLVSMERYHEVGFRVSTAGALQFFRPDTGAVIRDGHLALPEGAQVTSYAMAEPRTRVAALGLSNGAIMVLRDAYKLEYPDGERVVTPSIEYPLGEAPIQIDDDGKALKSVAIQQGSQGFNVAAYTEDGRLLMLNFEARTNFMTGQTQLVRSGGVLERPDYQPTDMLLSADMRDFLVGDRQGRVHHYDVSNVAAPKRTESVRVVDEGVEVGAMEYLLGTVSLVVGGSDGSISQWFMVRDENNQRHLTKVRDFNAMPGAITVITPEYTRKGFLTGDTEGNIALHFPTSHRTLLEKKVSDNPIRFAINGPSNDALIAVDTAEQLTYYDVRNPHPEASMSALWDKVWYEGREDPDYVWQSSSATDEFEAKFSLVPLTVGTIKAAFYAMLFAMPLAIMGAIYSAYFMTPKMRGFTKPTIEIMEALPTVILGFLAGLWFAPFLERNLPAVFSILLLLPVMILAVSFVWFKIPGHVRQKVPSGFEALMLIPLVLWLGWVCIELNPVLQVAFFNGDMRQWLTDQGYTYDQRNALVVGIAMGFAVIPTIYSIAEEAVFGVPKHLTQGSLALGATTWQTVTRVVLLTASPGIFSAVMIGFGRAVGETMIVLMATGNSPVVNFNIFEGMRTLSANIAVEMPEAEVHGTHYRVLFLAGLLLFMITFAFNTVAEIVRQRLRKKYASI